MSFLSWLGVAFLVYIVWMFFRLSRGFPDHMRVVNALDLSRNQGATLSRLSHHVAASRGRPLAPPERLLLGTVIAGMSEEFAAMVATKAMDERVALDMVIQEAQAMELDYEVLFGRGGAAHRASVDPAPKPDEPFDPLG